MTPTSAASTNKFPFLLSRLSFALMGLVHVVTPLLFFTALTRNPYYTQIVLLNAGIALCGVFWFLRSWINGDRLFPRFAGEWPLAFLLMAALFSTVFSFYRHEMLRSGIFYEGARIWWFTLINSVVAFYLPMVFTKPLRESNLNLSIWSDIVLAALWAMCWFGFHSMKDPDPNMVLWDTYGAFLWAAAMGYAVVRTRHGEALEFFHVIFAVSLVAGGYAILQYFGRDIIWTTPIQPYGGRPVSTFGNPNFLSSYMVFVSPVALAFGVRSKTKNSWGYLLIALVASLTVLCTLTRSSYVGLFAAFLMATLMLFLKKMKASGNVFGAAALLFVVLVLAFPRTPVSSEQSPLARITEIFTAVQAQAAYGSWHQRILIWSSAWDMLKENILFGKGWGCFELFYPFYQGKWILTEPFSGFRTHANNAHNILLEIWSQMGTVGTGIAIWLLIALLYGGWKIIAAEENDSNRVVLTALMAGMGGFLADNFFGNVSIFFAVPAFLFWWFVGALFNESKQAPVSPPGRALRLTRRVVIVLLVMVCGSAVVYFYRRWKEEVFYFQGFRQARTNQIGPSIKSLERANAWFPGDVNNNYELGNSYGQYAKELSNRGLKEEARKYQERSIKAYEEALKANPGYDEIYFNIGVTHAQLGQLEAARRCLEIAVFINPLLKEAYQSLGSTLLNLKDVAAAVRIFEQGVEVFPKDKDLWNNLGYCYSQIKNPDKSFEAYKKAYALDPSFAQAWQNLTVAAAELKRTDPVLEVPRWIRSMEENLAKKNYPEAKKAAERVVAALPENPDARLSLGNILFYLGDREGAARELKKAIELRPDFAIARVNLGRLYQMESKFEEARAQFNAALAINPSDNEAKQALASLPPEK